ncbi:MAG: Asp-tRNA(Asn)/Glu-tRNA(Gln) amidotransferase subunit GatB [Candidatus Omnitrophica bacterium]|nr:Asp-tRNA(Asn)/Glu-tRNA(Gln) amidotransferase subunit GatB [Candidatus Omnitrophota bacterium]
MKNFEVVIGLEVHVHLLTQSKAFCGCSTKFGLPPNSATCPVCLGLPGVLPVLNEKAFLYAVKTALALNCQIQDVIKFDRKNYYYPDLPKNFQISQYEMPLAHNGYVDIEHSGREKKIRINRVHLEEDAGKLMHDEKRGLSYLDLNRTGIPLLEIVSEPDLRSAEETSTYLQNIKSILLYLKVSDCNMEEGSLRCDANISVRPKGENALGVKAELKNMNSFKAVRDALSYEGRRQIDLRKKGEKIAQETRLWDEAKAMTAPMRTKEETHDYRYFPEPDLAPFTIERVEIEKIKSALPELPQVKKKRFISKYKVSEYDANALTRDRAVSDFFEETIRIVDKPKEIVNWLLGDVAAILNERKIPIEKAPFKPAHLASILRLIQSEEITGKIAKEVLQGVFDTGSQPEAIVDKKGLKQIKDAGELSGIIEGVLTENKKSVEDYKKGKKNAITFMVGQVMKKTKGKANPQKVNEILRKKLGSQI